MAEPTYDSVKFVKQQIEKPGDETAKWRLVNRGLAIICGIFVVTDLLILVRPSVSGTFSSIAQAVIISIGSLVSVGCGSIAAVEWKNRSTLDSVVKTTSTDETQKIETNQPEERDITGRKNIRDYPHDFEKPPFRKES